MKQLKMNLILNYNSTRIINYCKNKQQILEIISDIASQELKIKSEIIFQAIISRESMGSTGIGKGIAIPHGKLKKNISKLIGVFVRLEQPISFNSIDNQPVDLLFSLFTPLEQHKKYLQYLSLIAKYLSNDYVCYQLRLTKNNKNLYNKIINLQLP